MLFYRVYISTKLEELPDSFVKKFKGIMTTKMAYLFSMMPAMSMMTAKLVRWLQEQEVWLAELD